jgi:5'(3')-deoxyribonucleotidase
MLKPVIAIDIDEVLSPFVDGLITWHNREFGTSFHFQDFFSYEFNKVWGGDLESAVGKCSLHFEIREPVLPIENALRVLNSLKKSYELIIVTSRMLKHKSQTEAWLEQHFPKIFSAIVHCNIWDKSQDPRPILKKSVACLQYHAQYLIDDAPMYIEEAAGTGIQGLLFGEYPWNRQIQDHPLIHRVNNWDAVEHYFFPE